MTTTPLGRPTCCSSCRGTGVSAAGQGMEGDQVCRACSGFGRQLVLYTRCYMCSGESEEPCELCSKRADAALLRARNECERSTLSYQPPCDYKTDGCTGPLGHGLVCLECFAAISGTAA